jgi:hypothetical protein
MPPPLPSQYTGPPMDLANKRENGVRALYVNCIDCGHDADVNVDDQPGHLAVPWFATPMKCSKCGSSRSLERNRLKSGNVESLFKL